MQLLAQRLAFRFGSGHRPLGALIGLGVLRRTRLRRLGALDLLKRLSRFSTTLMRRIERVLLTLHSTAHRGERRSRSLCGAAQSSEGHLVLGDQRALLGDVDVEGVEFDSRGHDRATGLGSSILGISDTR